jgi:hypothetical protein
LQENPGGTSGRYVTVKLEYRVVWSLAGEKETVEVANARSVALENLYLLWTQWADYMIITSDKFAVALLD